VRRLRSGLGTSGRPHVLFGAVVIAGFAFGGCTSSVPAARQTTTPPHPSPASSSASAGDPGSRTARSARRCTTSGLRAKLVAHGAEASQTFSRLVLTNLSKTECYVNGYPSITAIGHTTAGHAGVLPLAITHGTYFRPDPGPHLVRLAGGQSASCVVETELAYSGDANPDTITELRIAPPDLAASETIDVDLGATGPPGKPVPMEITALVAGISGPPQSP
jgi:hypothetical protein